jgi:hypothetical protein
VAPSAFVGVVEPADSDRAARIARWGSTVGVTEFSMLTDQCRLLADS